MQNMIHCQILFDGHLGALSIADATGGGAWRAEQGAGRRALPSRLQRRYLPGAGGDRAGSAAAVERALAGRAVLLLFFLRAGGAGNVWTR